MHYGPFIILLVRLIIYLLKEEEKIPEMNRQTEIEYFVNGKKIQMAHIHNCKKILGIQNDKVLTDKDINNAYFNVYNEVAELREKVQVYIDIAELRAAKSYLQDRWSYLAFKN